jgi:hypothetical protein
VALAKKNIHVSFYRVIPWRQLEQYLFRKETVAMPLSMYTSYEANFPSQESQLIASRLFMTLEIGSTLTAVTLACELSAAVNHSI